MDVRVCAKGLCKFSQIIIKLDYIMALPLTSHYANYYCCSLKHCLRAIYSTVCICVCECVCAKVLLSSVTWRACWRSIESAGSAVYI